MIRKLFALGIDVETTGLDIDTLDLLEVGIVAYDDNLNQINATEATIYHDLDDLRMNGTVAIMHTDNGLLRHIDATTVKLLAGLVDVDIDAAHADHRVLSDVRRSMDIIRAGYIEPMQHLQALKDDDGRGHPNVLSSVYDFASAPSGTIATDGTWIAIKHENLVDPDANTNLWHFINHQGETGPDVNDKDMSEFTLVVQRWGKE